MKKHILLGIAGALALMGASSCNQNLLNIPQKGVVAYENFYETDEDAVSALTAMYAKGCEIESSNNYNQPSWNVLSNAPGDELYWGGNSKSDHIPGQEINEFRGSFSNDNPHVNTVYRWLYALIYRCNLVIDNFYGEDGELMTSATKKQCVAEARAMRAWAHFMAAVYFYNPPKVEHVLAGDARPTNCDHDELLRFAAEELSRAIPDLPERKGPDDKDGAVRLTKGAALSFLGKIQVFQKDWTGAKTSLKQVISSGNYKLLPTSRLDQLFHRAGDGCSEKVFEFNIVDHESRGEFSSCYHFQRNQALFFRQMKLPFPSITIQVVGWGNNMGPTKKFVDAMLAHEPNSARRKTWFVSYEELLTEFDYVSDVKADGTEMTREEKLMDGNRGLDLKKYNDLYANYGYFWVKRLPYRSDLIHNHSTLTDENRIIMRYAEVLLLYAEACAMTGDNDGLQYLNEVAERAEAPTYDALTMENVKQEKWFELAWEGTRWPDLVRWGDAATELAFKTRELTPYLTDDFYEYGTLSSMTTGRPHAAVILYKDDGWAEKGGGWKSNHNEYYPIPFSVLEVNDELKQNPYWEKFPSQESY